MARHNKLSRLDIGLPHPGYMEERNRRQFARDCKAAKKCIEFLSMSPEAKKLWSEMYKKEGLK